MCWRGRNCPPPRSIKNSTKKKLGEDVELDLTPGALEKTNDPVRMYLREMGTVPLLTREGEVEIAKRIERGQLRVLKALSRSPIVINELLAMGEDLKKGVRSIKEVVTFDEEEITDEILQNRLKEFTGKIDDLAKAYKKAEQLQREVRRGFAEEASQGLSPLPPGAGARAWCSFAVRPQAGLHQHRAQAADRPRQQDGRQHALARPPGPEPGEAKPTPPAAKTRKRNIAASRAPSAPNWKSSRRKPASPSRNSSAPSAKSSRATWMRSRPSAS